MIDIKTCLLSFVLSSPNPDPDTELSFRYWKEFPEKKILSEVFSTIFREFEIFIAQIEKGELYYVVYDLTRNACSFVIPRRYIVSPDLRRFPLS